MKTTLEIDEDLLNKAKQILGAHTIREAVQKSLQAVVRQKGLQELADSLGTFEFDMTRDDLKQARYRRTRRRNASR